MQYLGGKSRLAKKFAPILDAALLERGGRFVEPFVGGMNVAPALSNIRVALFADAHPALIRLYQAMQFEGYDPPADVPEWLYQCTRLAPDVEHPETAVVAFGCSFGGKEWAGYARSNRPGEDYARWARNSLRRKFPVPYPCKFLCCRFDALPALRPSVIYCDPPYRGTTSYRKSAVGVWEPEKFDRWAEARAAEGHLVFVSEFEAPGTWEEVWSLERKRQVDGTGRTCVDRLFRVPARGETFPGNTPWDPAG